MGVKANFPRVGASAIAVDFALGVIVAVMVGAAPALPVGLARFVIFTLSVALLVFGHKRPRLEAAIISIGTVLIAAWLCPLLAGPVDRVVFTCLALIALRISSSGSVVSDEQLLCVYSLGLLYLLTESFGLLFFGLQRVSHSFGTLAEMVGFGGMSLGANASGVWIALYFSGLAACRFHRFQTGMGVSSVRLLAIVMLPAVLPWLAEHWIGPRPLQRGFDASMVWLYQWSLIPACVLLAGVSTEEKSGTEETTLWRKSGGASRYYSSALLLLGILVCLSASARSQSSLGPRVEFEGKNITFVGGGIASDFSSPSWDRMTLQQLGLFGEMLQLLRGYGANVEIYEAFDEVPFSKTNILVLTNWGTVLGEEQLNGLHNWIEEGGALLLLADHTDLLGQMAPTNEILDPYGIDIRFDTAMETSRSFCADLQLRFGTVLDRELSSRSVQIMHGCSLQVGPPARPFIVGSHMFGDIGNVHNGGSGGFLGDYALSRREGVVGDLVLAATVEVGAGRVLVFGDTSPFQSLALSGSLSLVTEVFAWCCGRDLGVQPYAVILVIISALAGLVLTVLGFSFSPVLFVVTCTLVLASTAPVIGDNLDVLKGLDDDRPRLLLHDGNFPSYSLEQFKDDSITGLMSCAMRAGRTAAVGNVFKSPLVFPDVREVVILGAGEPFSPDQALRLLRFVETGGHLVVMSGPESAKQLESVLSEVGLEVVPTPMGAAPVMTMAETQEYMGPQFKDAWIVNADEGVVIEYTWKVSEVMILAKVAYGQGHLTLIADEEFILDDNFESESDVQMQNVDFFKTLMGWH